MKDLSWFLLGVVILPGSAFAADGPPIQNAKAEHQNADVETQKAFRELLEVADYDKMAPLPTLWLRNLSVARQKKLLASCLLKFGSSKALALRLPENVVIRKPAGPQEIPVEKGKVILRQDVRTEGGRCAWAVEKLLRCDLPIIKGTGDERDRLVRQAYVKVIEAMALPGEGIALGKLSSEERAKLASANDADRDLLAKLAKDGDVKVRRAVAANLKTPVYIVTTFLKDPDPQVREAAFENLTHTRLSVDD